MNHLPFSTYINTQWVKLDMFGFWKIWSMCSLRRTPLHELFSGLTSPTNVPKSNLLTHMQGTWWPYSCVVRWGFRSWERKLMIRWSCACPPFEQCHHPTKKDLPFWCFASLSSSILRPTARNLSSDMLFEGKSINAIDRLISLFFGEGCFHPPWQQWSAGCTGVYCCLLHHRTCSATW